MQVNAPATFGPSVARLDEADPNAAGQQEAQQQDSAADGNVCTPAHPQGGLQLNAALVSANINTALQARSQTQTAQSGRATIQADPGYLAGLEGIAKSNLSMTDKLKMAWDTTKYYWRGSDTAQGATQIAGGTLEIGTGLGITATSGGVAGAIGAVVAVHGADTVGAGIDRIRGGDGQTATFKAVKAATGSPAVADAVDQAIPFAGAVAGTGVAVTALKGGAAAATRGAGAEGETALANTQKALTQQIGDLRATLTGNAKVGGNIGIAQIDIPGIQSMMAASSRIANPSLEQQTLGFVGAIPEQFPSSVVPLPNGYPLLRSVDSEAKILNNIAAQLGDKTGTAGTINLLTERAPCESCSNIIRQFRIKYPNIKINVMNNGGVVSPTKGVN